MARADLPTTVSKLKRAGADHVTVPSRIAAYQLAHASVRPEIGSFISRALGGEEIELIEVLVSDHPWMAGKSLRELNLTRRADIIVFAIVPKGGRQLFNPSPDTLVSESDMLLVVARSGARKRLLELD